MFKDVLFDLDGVITDTAEFYYCTQKKLSDKIGVPLGRSSNEQLKGVNREDSLILLLAHGEEEEQFSKTEFLELVRGKNGYYLEMIQSITLEDVFPGILELLRDLWANDIKISLAFAGKSGPFPLAKVGPKSYSDTIADPTKVANGKSEPDIFLLATKKIGLTPRDRIGVEDLKAGAAAVIASGAQPIGVGRSEDLGENISVVPDTASLTLDYLKKTWQPNAQTLYFSNSYPQH